MTSGKEQARGRLDRFIAEEFGVNASYVSHLLNQYEQEPSAVDEEWRFYFDELLGNGGNREPETAAPSPGEAATKPSPTIDTKEDEIGRLPLRGPALRIAQNMEVSLGVPTATSQREIPIKLLDENRRLINAHLKARGRRVSFTHLIARAILDALEQFPQLNDSYESEEGKAYRVRREDVNLGIAVDILRKDGTRTLLVPNMKNAGRLSFSELLESYDDVVERARDGKLRIEDFQDTTISLTNPGTLGTTGSNPRLMAGQGLIVATGSIAYPPEFQAMAPEALSRLGISKVMTLTSTYDHRIIQGAESGAFLALIEDLLNGKEDFYDRIFQDLRIPYKPFRWSIDRNPAILGEERHRDEIRKQARVFELINAYRVRGHLIADIDPLGRHRLQYHPELDIETYDLTIWDLDREFDGGGLRGTETATLREIVERLHDYYCGKVGIEYRYIQSPEEKEWIRSRVEREPDPVPVEARRQMLWKLISAELFEQFLARKYPGQKRFSIEGAESLVALLDQLIESSAVRDISDITIGMSHRGRLNVIANVIGRFCERIFTSFEGTIHPRFPHDQGDVKYHQGASGVRETADGKQISLTVAPNPSHLEFINPVVEGMVRAGQDRSNRREAILPVLIHGDAAFAGEGVVAETLNLSQLPGYRTRGTIHIIVNNQLGFTTLPEYARSSTYSTDVAKMIQAPIFHVNGDDVDAVYNVLRMALDYRLRYRKDVVIDLMGFRKHGHNEGDEPTYTQPGMYSRIREHPGVRELYASRLIDEGVISAETVDSLMAERTRRYENALLGAKEIVSKQGARPELRDTNRESESIHSMDTGVGQETLSSIASAITQVPKDFNVNPKITGLLGRRARMASGEIPVDWGMAEALAFGSLVVEGVSVRLTGQDSVRGTFSQRHATLHDKFTDETWTPLAELAADGARFSAYDSPLSEAGVLGFEYGYSVVSPADLVLWEAQFGDFVNAAQVIVDQFIAAGEEKWNQKSRLVLLLPHGYEGQGPEHSSARLERFLQLCADDNMQVANCTTSAQYFHLLRRQALRRLSKPLIIMTPKSLLRSPTSASPIEAFQEGSFLPVIPDEHAPTPQSIKRVLICSGKIYRELAQARENLGDTAAAIIRLELLYPFPRSDLADQLANYRRATSVRWIQEEPANQGAWSFVRPRLRSLLGEKQVLSYVGRQPRATTATGSHTIHQMEQRELVSRAFAAEIEPAV